MWYAKMLKYLKKCWLENCRKARECDRKMSREQRQIEAWLSNSYSLEDIERKQRMLTHAGDDMTKLNQLIHRGHIWE
jgi:hypothetical protein